jgi:L-alanine-DL-glutamate epimerase-like enolase superfamily enzyme
MPMSSLKIERIEVHEFSFEMKDMAKDASGFNLVYKKGSIHTSWTYAMKVFTNEGVVGEYVGGCSPTFAQFNMFARQMIGRNPLEREKIYNDTKRALRKYDKMGMGPFDIALWDLAGKYYKASVSELLGGWKKTLPCYASTYHGDRNGGLDSPQAYADFALECQRIGYPAFKIHGWDDYDIAEEVATIKAVRSKVGDEMDLMIDPASVPNTFLDALKIGRACDDAHFTWLEDPYKDTGISEHGHRKLRQCIRTPLLVSEHVRGLEQHVNFIEAEGTDLVRVDPEYDGGITGAMKIAHAAEGFGLDVEIHAPGPAHRHVMSAIRNTNYYEMALMHPLTEEFGRAPVYTCGYRDGLDAIDANGHVPVPTGPGLGVTYDWDLIMKNRRGGRSYP